ncbi:general substrate transporter [Fusarium coicis]|nr:general substrate transporter [Fusarium coicis]
MSPQTPPPSYKSVVQGLISKTDGKQLTADQLNTYAASLTPAEKSTIANAPLPDPKNLTPEEVAKFHEKVQKDLTDPATLELFKAAARDAVKAYKELDQKFASIYTELAKIDSDNNLTSTEQFLPKFENIQNSWRKVLKDSRTLAADVSVYAKSFDTTIIPVVADATLDAKSKLAIIDAAKQNTEGYHGRADDIKTRLEKVVDDFLKFTGEFGKWGQKAEGDINNQIKTAQKQQQDLLDHLRSLQKRFIGFGVGAGIGVALIIGGFFAGPLAPLFWVAGGIITAGFGIGLIATGIDYSNTKNALDAKKKEIESLNTKVKSIQSARTTLQNTLNDDVAYIKDHMNAITGVWGALMDDTEQIKKWIESGESFEKIDSLPPALKINVVGNQLSTAVALYTKIGEYLSEYSSGMINANIPEPKK